MTPHFLKTLVPRKDANTHTRSLLTVLLSLTWIQWAHFLLGWFAWACDGVDFFSVSLTVPRLTVYFHKEPHEITTAITLTLLFRVVGAAIFGILSDRFGRKWPLVADLLFIAVLQLGAGFVQTFTQMLVLRSLFGVGMGGIWGLATSTALENFPTEARGFASGFLQQGYASGYLIAAVINLWLVPETKTTWRSLFWTASGLSAFAAVLRMLLPESDVFLRAKEQERLSGHTRSTMKKTKVFLRNVRLMWRRHWLLFIYAVLLMSAFNFLSHGSQDLYPTYLQVTKGLSPHNATVATIIANLGSICGGIIGGMTSQHIGRRVTVLCFVCFLGAFIPLWIIPSSFSALALGAFCLQFGVAGAWGIVPIQLAELSPPAFRATFPGVTYQLGNMVSSASAQIEATAGDRIKTTIMKDGKPVAVSDYAKVQGIFIGSVAAFLIIIAIIGPENHGSNFEDHKLAIHEEVPDESSTVQEIRLETMNRKLNLEKV